QEFEDPRLTVFPRDPNFVLFLEDYHFQTMIQLENGIGFAPGVQFFKNNLIGRYSRISSRTIAFPATIMGSFCSVGDGVRIGLPEHPMNTLMYNQIQMRSKGYFEDEKINQEPTIIGHDTWIGDYACIKKGIKVGNGACIGAMSMVTKNVPDFAIFAIVAGNPAKIIRYKYDNDPNIKNPEELRERLLKNPWWNLPMDAIMDLRVHDVPGCLERLKEIYANLSQNGKGQK
ncbi:MAG: CatB-related O-acetyltransferase, partial [Rickettsiales bacterium]|nr:CatB-related O-acetyltransferase [Rickettsiales bacterium]